MKIQIFATSFEWGLTGENVGVGRIKSFLNRNKRAVEVTYFDNNGEDDEFSKVDIGCKLYGFSIYHTNVKFFLTIINKIKEVNPNSLIFLGSKFATAYYTDILEGEEFKNVDFVVLGDGEYSILDIIQYIEQGNDIDELVKNHPNIASRSMLKNKEPAVLDINSLPYPDRTWVKKNNYITAYICDCHGCIGKCSFCTYANYYHKWNGRSAFDLYNEIIEIYSNYSIRNFVFTGGSFEDPGKLGKEKLRELCNLLINSDVKFSFRFFLRSETFKNCEEDIELLKLMKKAGLGLPAVGIESGNNEDLLLYNKRATLEDNKRILQLLKDVDMYNGMFGFIMFNPYSTLERLKENYEFLLNYDIANIAKFTSKLYIHKNTAIYDKADSDGLIDHSRCFYIDKELEYSFANDEVKDIWKFIKEYFWTDKVSNINKIVEDLMTSIYCFYELINNGMDFRIEFEKTAYENSQLLKEYFYHLYINNDIKYCKLHYDKLIHDLYVNQDKFVVLKNKLMRSMFKEKIMMLPNGR